MKKMTGSQIIVNLLKQHGIKLVAGIPGGSILPLYDELYNSDIQHVLVRQEQAAGFIAQGIARTTGKAAVCMATSGPGAMNLLTSIADARCDSIPLVAITGQVNTDLIGTDALQEADTFGLSFPITKHSMMVKTPEELVRAIPLAFAIAENGRPGPVLIDVPRNVQKNLGEVPDDIDSCFNKIYDDYLKEQKCIKYRTKKEDLPELIEKFCKDLLNAKKPVLYVGGGANNPRAGESISKFLKLYHMPVVSSLMGIGTVPVKSDEFLGMVGMHGSYIANKAMYESDLVLAAGVRFDDRATGVVAKFCPNASILHIDIDAAEVNKILPTDANIVEDTAFVFEKLISSFANRDTRCDERDKWLSDWSAQKKNEFVSLEMDCDAADCCGNRTCGVKNGKKIHKSSFIYS